MTAQWAAALTDARVMTVPEAASGATVTASGATMTASGATVTASGTTVTASGATVINVYDFIFPKLSLAYCLAYFKFCYLAYIGACIVAYFACLLCFFVCTSFSLHVCA